MRKIFTLLYVLYIFPVYLVSCSYNISMNHSEGQATDVIDSNQDPEADISPQLSIPAAVL